LGWQRRGAELALNVQMWSADPGDATKPPGLFAGVTPIGATTGGGTNAMTDDLGKLFAALAANGGGKTAVIIAAMPQAAKLKATVGPKFDYDIIASTALPTGTVVVLEVASFVSGFGSTAEFNVPRSGRCTWKTRHLPTSSARAERPQH